MLLSKGGLRSVLTSSGPRGVVAWLDPASCPPVANEGEWGVDPLGESGSDADRYSGAGLWQNAAMSIGRLAMAEDIRVEQHDGWRKLILNRPEKLNAVNAAMLTNLLA